MNINHKNMSELKGNNYLIDRYLDEIKRKINLKQKPNKYEYFVYYCYYLNVIKFLYCYSCDYEMKLYLYDISYFMGGIHEFNCISFIFGCILGAIIDKYLHLNSAQSDFECIKVLLFILGHIDQNPYKIINYNKSDLGKIRINTIFIFKVYKYVHAILSKLFIIFNFKIIFHIYS